MNRDLLASCLLIDIWFIRLRLYIWSCKISIHKLVIQLDKDYVPKGVKFWGQHQVVIDPLIRNSQQRISTVFKYTLLKVLPPKLYHHIAECLHI
ncbi:hypothetical protein FRX31_006763 [Thalictrum thalictroides]|uniref:Uncharacterized protein n=1 Tax=Thalictrum thalictroides TaxID=46969 RepID=A0A7J6X2T6_THATH|nr:hypothetical protein FRX31_006763 [Thalictrum thalictroides]